jgi:hypothetical protein
MPFVKPLKLKPIGLVRFGRISSIVDLFMSLVDSQHINITDIELIVVRYRFKILAARPTRGNNEHPSTHGSGIDDYPGTNATASQARSDDRFQTS